MDIGIKSKHCMKKIMDGMVGSIKEVSVELNPRHRLVLARHFTKENIGYSGVIKEEKKR